MADDLELDTPTAGAAASPAATLEPFTDLPPLQPGESLLPPEESFWEKYSPNLEFPVSSVSALLFTTAGAFFFWWFIDFLSKDSRREATASIDNRAVVVIDDRLSYGPAGGGSGGGDAKEADPDAKKHQPEEKLPSVDVAPTQLPTLKRSLSDWSPDMKGMEDILDNSENLKKLAKAGDVGRQLLEGMSKRSGSGGGDGAGSGNAGTGSGTGKGNSMMARTVRWNIVLEAKGNTDAEAGRDYLNQLMALRARLLIPAGKNKFRLISDLSRPNEGEVLEDISHIQELPLTDDRFESVQTVCVALGLKARPTTITAIFPNDIVEQLATMERNYRGKNENQILQTTFKIVRQGGSYKVIVSEQKLR